MSSGLANLLRLLSTLACAVVAIAFVMWAADEGRSARDGQVAEVGPTGQGSAQPDPAQAAPGAPPVERDHNAVRAAIEHVNDTLVSPFNGFASAENQWAAHGIPALLALLTYGLLARLLIAYVPARR